MSDPSSRLGKYEIVGILGQGAMGVVYEGLDSVIDRRVAIKTIRAADLDADDPEPARRFMIEARAAGKLNHPNIVGLYDHGNDAGTVYLVLELVTGRELQRHIDGGTRFSLADTLRLMGELLSALGYSHRQGVVHRDVKPANIFITDEGSVKLGDFGIARIEATQRTRVGTLLGTPSHMAPEQIRGEAADARSDLYAAGVVLYELLTGRRPFTGPMLKLAMKVLNEEPPVPSTFAPELPAAVDGVVMRALAKMPADRYQSALEFWQALAAALGPLAAADRAGPQGVAGESAFPTVSSGIATQESGTLPWSSGAPAATAAAFAVTGATARATATAAAAATSESTHPTGRALPQTSRLRRTRTLVAAAIGLALVLSAAWLALDRDPQPRVPEALVDPVPSVRTAPAEGMQPPVDAGETGIAPDKDDASGEAPAALAPRTARQPTPVTVQPPAADPVLASPAPTTTPTPPPTPPPLRSSPATAATSRTAPAAATRTAAALPTRREPARTGTATAPPDAVPPAAVAPAPAQKPARCSDILLKASLEPLSDEEGSFLRRECR